MKTRIIVDSTADLRPGLRERLTIVPLTILFGEEEYIDGVTISQKQFYEKLVESDVLPTTSQPSPEAFAKAFREARDAGEEAVVITVSSKLSGTWQSAMIAAQDFPEGIHIVDSRNVALGSGILAELALQLADFGMGAADIAEQLTRERENVRLMGMVNTMEYLKRGGRVSKAVALAGGLLSIKPVIGIRDGEIVLLGKARGSRQGNNLLIKEIEAANGVDFSRPLLLGYTGLSDAMLQKYIADSAALWEGHIDALPVSIVGSVVGTHAGPGCVAVAFFSKSEG